MLDNRIGGLIIGDKNDISKGAARYASCGADIRHAHSVPYSFLSLSGPSKRKCMNPITVSFARQESIVPA
jgi:hypothetical protein